MIHDNNGDPKTWSRELIKAIYGNKVPDGLTEDTMTDADKLEAVATVFDGIDDATERFLGELLTEPIDRMMQADLRRMAERIRQLDATLS